MTGDRQLDAPGKIETGIAGFDFITHGGLPARRLALLAGTAGSGKTIFAVQFLAAGILEYGVPGVFVTFEESSGEVRRDMVSFGWPIEEWEEQGLWAFVDASMADTDETIVTGDYELTALSARIGHAVETIGAGRVAIDSLAAVFLQFADATVVRRELLRTAQHLKKMGVTSLLTSERPADYGALSRHGVEEFVVDSVIILRNVLEEEKRRRTVEVFKMRGSDHQRGEVPFTIENERGVVVLPLSAMRLGQASSTERISSGVAELDTMCGGGFFRDSMIIVSGATGTGKTLLTAEFVSGGAAAGERSLVFAFEESRDQLVRNAASWGRDFPAFEEQGVLRLECAYPESYGGLEELQLAMKQAVEAWKPRRVAIDSLSAVERVGQARDFREFVLGMTSFLKERQVTGFFTSTTPSLYGSASISEGRISTITDTILMLRYVEMDGEIRRGLTVLKMRGSAHQKAIREFTIDGDGMHVGAPFRGLHGILAGDPRELPSEVT
jgi:circadian clock protein KaiC